jgi:hypothetical protein
MINSHQLRPAGTCLFLVLCVAGLAQGQITQTYSEWSPEMTVKVANFQGEPVEVKYRQCTYTAMDEEGNIIRQDRLWYFTNPYDESRGLTGTCNRWVYWLKLDPQDRNRDMIWARCPTPHHPRYTEMQAELQGEALWQIIPEGNRQPKQSIHVLVERFAPMIASSPDNPPFVSAETKVTIQPMDFSDVVFQ